MLLYSVYGGSRLYNLITPESDQDIRGVFVEPADVFFGLDTMDYYEDVPSDTVMYSLRKFVSLALKNNPNTLELLFAPRHAWITKSLQWEMLYTARELFISQRAIKAYKGFLLQAYDDLTQHKSNRLHLVERYGFDTKNASHIVRLLYNLRDIITRGIFSPQVSPLARDMIYDIKTGAYKLSAVMYLIEHMRDNIFKLPISHMRLEPDYDAINKIVISIHKSILR